MALYGSRKVARVAVEMALTEAGSKKKNISCVFPRKGSGRRRLIAAVILFHL